MRAIIYAKAPRGNLAAALTDVLRRSILPYCVQDLVQRINANEPRLTDDRKFRRTPMVEPVEPQRLPPPWQVVEHDESFEVRDATGHSLAYVYFGDAPISRRLAGRLTRDEARRVALDIAKLPEF